MEKNTDYDSLKKYYKHNEDNTKLNNFFKGLNEFKKKDYYKKEKPKNIFIFRPQYILRYAVIFLVVGMIALFSSLFLININKEKNYRNQLYTDLINIENTEFDYFALNTNDEESEADILLLYDDIETSGPLDF